VIEFDERFVHVAPAPAFRRIVALDDRVTGLMGMRGGVAVRRDRLSALAYTSVFMSNPPQHPMCARAVRDDDGKDSPHSEIIGLLHPQPQAGAVAAELSEPHRHLP
jgi:hypothetical protein